MNEQQVAQLLQQAQATYVSAKDGVEWYRTPSGGFIGKRPLGNGYFEVRSFGAGSCNC